MKKSQDYKLTWKRGNAKLKRNVIHLSIPAGWSCKPWADECYAHANPETGKITDGENQKFRCYAATMEAIYPAHRKILWNNYQTLLYYIQDQDKLEELLIDSLIPELNAYHSEHEQYPKIRIFGTSGDFWHQNMYKACVEVARRLQDIRVYWYTKALPLWVNEALTNPKGLPPNLVQNASKGGRYDSMIEDYHLKYAQVVYSFEEAKRLGLPIDNRDELASEPGGPFAIPIHGTQAKGSDASKALSKLRKEGKGGYSKKKNI